MYFFLAAIDECVSNPCLNDYPCIDEFNHWKCACDGSRYIGLNCEIGKQCGVRIDPNIYA